MKYLRKKELMARYKVKSGVTIDLWEKRKLLPPRIRLGPNVVVWDEDDLLEFERTRPRGIGKEAAPAEVGA